MKRVSQEGRPSPRRRRRASPTPGDGVGRLFQETLYRRPFWMLVACILVNRTTWAQAKGVHGWLMRRGIHSLAMMDKSHLEGKIRHLGMSHARAANLLALARKWHYSGIGRWLKVNVLGLPGCGQYAADSWAIFIERRGDVAPKDKKLREYLGRVARDVQ